MLNLLIVAMASYMLDYSKQRIEVHVVTDTHNLAETLELIITGIVDKIDLTLQVSADQIQHLNSMGNIGGSEINTFLALQLQRNPDLAMIRVTDKEGDVNYGLTPLSVQKNINQSRQNFFIIHRNYTDVGLLIGKPVFGKISQQWELPFSRRINNSDGSFYGVVYGMIKLEHFQQIFSSINVGNKGLIVLRDDELGLIKRIPAFQGANGVIGSKAISSPMKEALRKNPQQGTYISGTTSIDGVERSANYIKFSKYPFYITVGPAIEEYLANWYQQVRITLAMVLIFILLSIALGIFLVRLLRRQQTDEDKIRKSEQQLIFERNQLQTLIKTIPDPLWLKDVNGVYLYCNPSIESFFGVKNGGVKGKTDYDFFDKAQADAFRESDRRALQTNDTLRYEEKVVLPGGRVELFEKTKSSTRDPEGNIIGVLGISHIITEQKKLEDDLRKSGEHFRGYFEQAMVGMATTSLEKGWINVNDALCNSLGYSREELMRSSWSELTYSEDLAVDTAQFERMLKGEIENYAMDKRFIHKDGHLVYTRLAVSCVRKSEGGIDYVVALVEDITERKLAELREKSRVHVLELIANDSSLAEVLEAIILSIEQENPDMLCSILLLDEADQHLLSGAAPSLPGFYNAAINGMGIGAGRGSCGTAAFTNKRVIVEDIQNHPYWAAYKDLAAKAELASCWSEPIHSTSGKVLGTFAIYHHKAHQPSKSDIVLIEQTASLASIAIEKIYAEDKLKLAASVFTHACEGITITDATGIIIDVNDTFTKTTGYSREEVIGQNSRILKSDRHSSEFYAAMWDSLLEEGYWYGEVWNRRKDGEVYAEMKTISAVRDTLGVTTHYVALCTDITHIKDHQAQLEHIAHFDILTDLPNRSLLADRLNHSILQCQRHQQSLAVVFLDLDGFKEVNDKHGHDVGDELLIIISRRMKEALREGDTLARFGGDEFVAVLADLAKIEDCEPVLERLLIAASERATLAETTLQVSASIGVTIYPQDGQDADQLIRHADQAMYVAKQAGKNRYHLFDTEQDDAIIIQRENIGNIRAALHRQEFVLYYQPKVNMRTGRVIGVEALIRWQHPVRGLVPPADFLPVIEGHDISLEIGEWVINTALTQISQWQMLGVNLPISVNISAYQLQQANFVTQLEDLLAAHPSVLSRYLELEVLETSALSDIGHVSTTMCACRKLGVEFALDDFGTGYSSLTYLRRLPASLIKIDQSFVRDMLTDPEDLAIVEGVVGLAKSFKREVIAEGVETVEHGTALLQLGCELAQGYGIARPMPAKNIPVWLKEWKPDGSWGI
ncbi:MAG: EAL domain-containing protein [Methylococcales bacterium]